MKRVDRSEILYSKAAALSAPTRYVLHILAALPILMFAGGFYALVLICDMKTSRGTIVIIDLLLACLLVNISLLWLLVSIPSIPRTFTEMSSGKRVAMMLAAIAMGLLLKTLMGPQINKLDLIHAEHCPARSPPST